MRYLISSGISSAPPLLILLIPNMNRTQNIASAPVALARGMMHCVANSCMTSMRFFWGSSMIPLPKSFARPDNSLEIYFSLAFPSFNSSPSFLRTDTNLSTSLSALYLCALFIRAPCLESRKLSQCEIHLLNRSASDSYSFSGTYKSARSSVQNDLASSALYCAVLARSSAHSSTIGSPSR